jgi:CHAD domain-containing protein
VQAAERTGRIVREVEHKFRVHGLFQLPDLSGLGTAVDQRGTVRHESTYFDTPDLRLARERITLRRRTGGHDEGWHLKLPASDTDPGIRDELQLPLSAAPADQPPQVYRYLVRAIVRQAPVEPRARLRTERTVRVFRDSDGAALAELVDDSVDVVAPDGQVTARFRELELEERQAASTEFVARVRDALTQAGAVGGEFVAKAIRALGQDAAAAPEVSEPQPSSPDQPARLAVAAYLRRYTRDLRAADLDARREMDDSVHQLRVAARRLRSGLRVFRPLLDQPWADQLRTELRWAASELGEFRDTEVLLERLVPGRPQAAEPGRDWLRRQLTARLAGARDQVQELLGSERYIDLHERLVAAASTPVTTELAERPAGEVLPPLVAQAWGKFAGKVEQLLTDEAVTLLGAPDEQWHAARIAAKRVRYAADAVAPVLGAEAARFAKDMSKVTDVLGEHQDAAHAAAVTATFAADAKPPLTFALGVLCGAERAKVTAARTEFARLWPKVSKEKLRSWFES